MRSERSVDTLALAASLVPVFTGLVASAMLAVDYLRPIPVFCGEGGGCDAVRHTAFAAPLGVPMPLIGLAGFLAIGVAALFGGRRARIAQLALAAGAGLIGAVLLGVQARIGHVCVYCAVADASGIVSALAAAVRLRRAPQAQARRSLVVVFAATFALAAAVALPVVLGLRATTVPQVIRSEMARTRGMAQKGAVTLVDFVDFECPFCRMTNAELEPLLLAHKDRVRVVRRQVPLRIHPHALDAARAACCGERLGKGDAMASALFAAPVEQLTPEHCGNHRAEPGAGAWALPRMRRRPGD